MPAIDYLLIGHITQDQTPDGPRLGGTSSYAAAMAQALGLRVGIVTSANPDDSVLAALPDVPIHLIPAECSTIFVNTYDEKGNRQQVTKGQARTLTYDDIPGDWLTAPIIHLGPMARELDDSLHPRYFPDALVGITPQGYMRAWDDQGNIYPVEWAGMGDVIPHATIILSDEDLGHNAAWEAEYAALAQCLVVTRGYDGATLYRDGKRQDIPAPDIKVLCHPTGAGDTYAAAFFAMLHRHPGEWERATQAAVTIASTYVETCVGEGVPTPDAIHQVLRAARVQAVLGE